MEPRTKNEKEVTRLAATLPALTDAQRKWISRNAIPAIAYWANKSGSEAWCSNCGSTFDDSRKQKKCPHCGAPMTEHADNHQRKHIHKSKWYTTIATTCGGWQVTRHYFVEHECRKGESQHQFINEAVQVWTNAQGEQVIMARNTHLCGFYYDVWNFNSPITIKHKRPMYTFGERKYDIFSHATKVCRVLPILRRNGFDGKIRYTSPDDLFRLLLTDNFAETLQKCGQYGLLGLYSNEFRNFDKRVAMICTRHGYIVKDAKMWQDYIDMCEELGKDIYNPQVCCPADLKAAHDKAMKKLEKEREEQRKKEEEEMRKRDLSLKKAFVKSYKRFVGLVIVGKGISITPLQTIEDFEAEGKAMHHCVASYWRETGSLVLSARTSEGKRLETIEINLKTFKIVQCRGVCNDDSPKHKDIIKLMNDHMGEVKRLARSKNGKKTKATKIAAAA